MAEQPDTSNREEQAQKVHTMRRLLATFFPHTPLFLATFLATALYAGAMTARVALVVPALRVLAQEVPDELEPQEAAAEEAAPPSEHDATAPEGNALDEQPDGEPGTEPAPVDAETDEPAAKRKTKIEHVLFKNVGDFSKPLDMFNRFLDRMDAIFAEGLKPILPDSVVQNRTRMAQVGTLGTVFFFFLCITLLSALANFSKHVLSEYLVVRVLVSTRIKLLRNLLDQPLAFYNEQKRGELISRMSSDVQSVTICLKTLTGPMILQPLQILMPAIVILFVKWWLFLVVAGFLTVISINVRKQSRKVRRRARVRQRTVARVTEAMVQMFSGIRVVKAFSLETEKVLQYTARNEDFTRDAMATEVAKALTRTRMEFFVHLSMILVIFIAVILLGGGGTVPVAAMAFLLIFLVQIYRPAKQLTNAYTDLQDHLAGARRTFEFMDLRPALKDKRDAVVLDSPVGTVRFEDVCFSYNGNGKVIDHINLEVPAGQVVALVGHSGAGKSTLANLVPRFYDPDSGRVTIDGTDIREFKRESLLRHIAIVTQEPFLFNTSIRENISYGKPGATEGEIIAAARAANIHDFILGLGRGYDTLVGERGANLSGGQGQRLTIARALVRDARILILDEATSNLDTESERAVQDALRNLMLGRTTLVIAHRLSTVQSADKICVMQDGRIAEVGSHDQLMDSASLYRRLYELQFAPG
jgi:subfamily B ATP-binding cassette protein MsbA